MESQGDSSETAKELSKSSTEDMEASPIQMTAKELWDALMAGPGKRNSTSLRFEAAVASLRRGDAFDNMKDYKNALKVLSNRKFWRQAKGVLASMHYNNFFPDS